MFFVGALPLAKKLPSLLPWGLPVGIVAAWVAYPGLTAAYKHRMAPSFFPDPEAKA